MAGKPKTPTSTTSLRSVVSEPTAIGEKNPARRVEEALKQVEKVAGGRASIVSALTFSPLELSEDQKLLLGMLADPDNDKRSLAKVVADSGLKIKDLLDLLRQARGAQAYWEALNRVYDFLPRVAGDVMERSIPHQLPCTACNGKGKVRMAGHRAKKQAGAEEDCTPCNGTGTFLTLPDLARQKVALELGGLLKPGGSGTTVNVDQRVAAGVGFFSPADLQRFHSASDEALYKGREAAAEATVAEAVVETTVVEK